MFAVKPLRDKALQEEICSLLQTKYYKNDLAYYAVELKEDLETVDKIIGICQFSIDKSGCIESLVSAPEREDDEAMIIMCRAVMSFMNNIGIHTMTIKDDACTNSLMQKTGIPVVDGVHTVDLDEFYKEPCHYNKNTFKADF